MTSPYWAAAQLKPNRAPVALHFLKLAGFEVYYPQIREPRIIRRQRVNAIGPLFPSYCFILIELQWVAATHLPGVSRLVLDGDHPASVPDRVIEDIRAREQEGFVVLPKPRPLRRGAPMKILQGPFRDRTGLYAGQGPQERVALLLMMLGSSRVITIPASHVAPVVPD